MAKQKNVSKVRSKLSISTYKQPMIFIILTMILINIVILIIAAFIALAIDDSFTSFMDAFGNGSVKWLITPNAVLSIENPQTLALAFAVLIIGMVLFSGTIIALTTNQIKEYVNNRKRGSGKVILTDHIAILNWNDKVPELVADLLNAESKMHTVMILADIDKHFAEKQIINAVHRNGKTKMSNLNVLFKTGDPLTTSYLYDISIEDAKAIIIMNKDLHGEVVDGMSKSDLNVIKTILNLGNIDYSQKPPIVAEVKNVESKSKIETMARVVNNLHPHVVLPVCFDRRLGQIIAQTIIHSNMEDVYLSLFSFEGSEVYYSDDSFESAVKELSEGIPLASKGKGSLVLSKNDQTKNSRVIEHIETVPLQVKDFDLATSIDVYIVGENSKLDFILHAFKEYEKLYNIGFTSQCIKGSEIEKLTTYVNESDKHVKIVLLSDETQEFDSLDANVIDNLIILENLLERKDVTIIVELLDPKNARIIQDFNIHNTIISNKIISLLLSKLALYPKTASFYENLLTLEIDETEDDHEVIIRKATNVFMDSLPLKFSSKKRFVNSFYEETGMICFGVMKGEILHVLSDDMMDAFVLEETDSVVLMKI
jgi:uncharacterized membrane protein YgdD (TMEM256/DUF423 family)